ncbi:MAG: helix-turn-helix domain-containing protein [Acidobacteriota bacterium]
MPVRLRQEEVVTIGVLAEKGQSRCEIARTLGASEGTVRYHLKRAAAGAADGRSEKPFRAEAMSGQIRAWMEERQSLKRPINVRELYEDLVHDWEYEGSYRSVLRYVRRRWPRPKIRT